MRKSSNKLKYKQPAHHKSNWNWRKGPQPIWLYNFWNYFFFDGHWLLQTTCSIACSENIFALIGIDCRCQNRTKVWARSMVRLHYMLNCLAKTFALISECTRPSNQQNCTLYITIAHICTLYITNVYICTLEVWSVCKDLGLLHSTWQWVQLYSCKMLVCFCKRF